jgi:uncharacterized protein YbjT (DUF2867 family)
MAEDNLKTALVFGATGLTGGFVTELLEQDRRYREVILFTRKPVSTNAAKTRQITFNPDNIQAIAQQIKGDHLFCCIGTTIKKAGSKKVFFETDHDLVVDIAQAAASNHVRSFVLVSSIGANPDSRNFYLRTKGQVEESLKKLTFPNLIILRPSMLLGVRREYRIFEEWGKTAAKIISPLLTGKLKKYRPVHAAAVAETMISSAFSGNGMHILESDQIENTRK